MSRDERLLAVQKRLDDWIADCEHYSELCDQKDLRIQRLEEALENVLNLLDRYVSLSFSHPQVIAARAALSEENKKGGQSL